MLELALAQPHHQSGADHRGTGHAKEEVQPTQPGPGEVAHVQAGKAEGGHHRPALWLALAQQRTADAIEGPVGAAPVSHMVGCRLREGDAGIAVARVLQLDEADARTRLQRLHLGVQTRQRYQRRGDMSRLGRIVAAEQVVEVLAGVIAIAGHDARRHHHVHE
ncbi:hypothetical protein D9M71_466840 [compost metagenome]